MPGASGNIPEKMGGEAPWVRPAGPETGAKGAIALPREFVDSRKQQRLRSAAEMYLSQQELDAPARFDVAEVYEENGQLRINYIENAFI